ncbi:MAG: hypothetical protein IKG69_02035, partial [Atopobiaceae bacterium]|nr:hypothetical protein [Atopobiaceae bacterium]
DVRHYLRTLERKPGALARSEVLAGYPTFKRIFDDHYTERPREFIEIVVGRHAEPKAKRRLIKVTSSAEAAAHSDRLAS